jgi:hypothetical protein
LAWSRLLSKAPSSWSSAASCAAVSAGVAGAGPTSDDFDAPPCDGVVPDEADVPAEVPDDEVADDKDGLVRAPAAAEVVRPLPVAATVPVPITAPDPEAVLAPVLLGTLATVWVAAGTLEPVAPAPPPHAPSAVPRTVASRTPAPAAVARFTPHLLHVPPGRLPGTKLMVRDACQRTVSHM